MAFAFAINIGDILYLWLTGIGMVSVVLVSGYFLGWFSKKASSDGVLLGMAEKLEDTPDALLYNSAVAIGPEGVIGAYQKMHPFETESI